MGTEHNLSAYDYHLPPAQLAARPLACRDASRLLWLDRGSGTRRHRRFGDLTELLRAGDTLVMNDTRVLKARVFGRRVATGGKVEALFLHPEGVGWRALLKTRGQLVEGEELCFGEQLRGTVARRHGRGEFQLACSVEDVIPFLEQTGLLPLPPYILKARGAEQPEPGDGERYQTVYAQQAGAVAAPTAGLHFTPELLARLEARRVRLRRVTLHVGLGTFLPIRSDDVREHRMHAEWYTIPEATRRTLELHRSGAYSGRVVAVGTTVVRTLEAWGQTGRASDWTELFIHPPYDFQVVEGLVTNFHLPGSTLLLLVSALVGRERLLATYRSAVACGYRFYSYGDAMAIL